MMPPYLYGHDKKFSGGHYCNPINGLFFFLLAAIRGQWRRWCLAVPAAGGAPPAPLALRDARPPRPAAYLIKKNGWAWGLCL